jgi:hypothetical protein
MKKIVFLLLTLTPCIINAQGWQWAKQIGGTGMDNAVISYIDNQHNLYVYGHYAINTNIPGYNGWNCYMDQDTLHGRDASFIAKYTSNGNLVWVSNVVSFPIFENADIIDMQYDSSSNALVLAGGYYDTINLPGCNLSSGGLNTFLSKVDLDGNCIWSKNIGPLINPTSLTFDLSGNIYMAGWAYRNYSNYLIDTCHFNGGTFIAKFNPAGTSLWAKTKYAAGVGYFTIDQLKYFNNNLIAIANIAGQDSLFTIDTISINIPCKYCSAVGLLCMDGLSNAKWLKVDGPASVIGIRSLGINALGDIYYFAMIGDTCLINNDSVFSQGNNCIIVRYSQSGMLTGLNHIKRTIDYFGGQNYWEINVLRDGSYYITEGFSGQAIFGDDTITSFSPLDLYVAHYSDSNVFLGVDHVGGGYGTSVAADETGVYITGIFAPFPLESGTITIGNETFSSYGHEDIVFAKHELMTGVKKITKKTDYSLVIYANPNKGSFRVKIPDDFLHKKNLVLNIYDNSSKVIRSQTLSLNQESPKIDIFGVRAGTYYVTISDSKKTYSGKMIVDE